MPPPGIHDLKAHLASLFSRALQDIAPDASGFSVTVERPKAAEHGDFACNLALQLAKPLKRNPREIAQALVSALPPSPVIDRTEVAGAGFINLFLRPAAKRSVVQRVLEQGDAYGTIAVGQGKKVQVEFVSANPTGPLHVGHGRGAAYGASLSSLLAYAGWDVTREYYVNDAGRQMDILAVSCWLRYLDFFGEHVPFPPNAYQGDYVCDMAEQMKIAHGGKLVRTTEVILTGTPGLPDSERADDEAKAQ